LNPEDHTQWVGAIVTNLQALETCLRYFLVRHRKQDRQFPKVGDRDAKKTYMSRFLSLGKIIRKYNSALDAKEAKYRVNEEVVHLRDAFAHGIAGARLSCGLLKTAIQGQPCSEYVEICARGLQRFGLPNGFDLN